jgi:hypothetical protein
VAPLIDPDASLIMAMSSELIEARELIERQQRIIANPSHVVVAQATRLANLGGQGDG